MLSSQPSPEGRQEYPGHKTNIMTHSLSADSVTICMCFRNTHIPVSIATVLIREDLPFQVKCKHLDQQNSSKTKSFVRKRYLYLCSTTPLVQSLFKSQILITCLEIVRQRNFNQLKNNTYWENYLHTINSLCTDENLHNTENVSH